MSSIDRLSIELSNRCRKACWFCYSASSPAGETTWTVDDLRALIGDCAAHGTRAVSFGGGEPLEAPQLLFPVLAALRGRVFRSFTTSGLDLDAAWPDVVAVAPDKVHVSIHHPGHAAEVARVVDQVCRLAAAGIASGVNLLVMATRLDDARAAVATLHAAGIDNRRIVFLPMRGPGAHTPTPAMLAAIAGGPFQSMTCLTGCAASLRFVAIGWDRTVARCSYTTARRPLPAPTHAALTSLLPDLGLTACGAPDVRTPIVRLSRRALDGHDVVRDRS
jgi:organic radical activating enzyme